MKPKNRIDYIHQIRELEKQVTWLEEQHKRDMGMVSYYKNRYEAYIELFKIVFQEKPK